MPLHRERDPDRWLRLAYAGGGVVTQVNDGCPSGPGCGGSMPSNSASSPAVVAVMLAALDVRAEHHVLEIGTGTGYNAALLAHRLGAERITSIEIDPDVATRARTALSNSGFGAVTVVTGEGAIGYPSGAPYDRVVVTAACHRVPYSWVAQARPGGRIVVPWADAYAGGLTLHPSTVTGTAWCPDCHRSAGAWLPVAVLAVGAK